MKDRPILEVKDFSVTYKTLFGKIAALKNVSLSLQEEEAIGIIGESGSGKSTLAYGMMDYLASNGIGSGEVLFKGEDLLQKSAKEMETYRGDRIAMVYQNPYASLNPSLTIGFQLDEVTIFHRGLSKAKARESSIEMLKALHMGDARGIVKRYPHQISGGMQQRVCIAMALLCQPDLMILDEPTTALDVTTEAVILELIAELRKSYRMSLVYISHDIGVVNKVSDKLAVMYRGEIVEIGPKEEIFRAPKHPYTRALINCLPRPGLHKDSYRLNTIPGYVRKRGVDESGCPFVDRCQMKTPYCQDSYGMREHSPGHLAACDRAYATDVDSQSIAPKLSEPWESGPRRELLSIDGLHKSYRSSGKKVYAVDGVTTSLESSSVLGIVGESGCGKSTLGHMVSGLIAPSSGKICFDGEDIGFNWKKRKYKTLQDIQLIFQNPGRSLNPSFSVQRLMERPLKKLLGIKNKKKRLEIIEEILRKVDLGREYLSRRVPGLSGGEMQRVAVARGFSISPSLVVCDEPTSALDASVQASVLNLLCQLQRDSEVAYIFISHDLHVINYLSDNIIVMYLGRICEFGSREEVISPPYHPYTEALLSAVPEVDPSLRHSNIVLEGSPPNPTQKRRGCPFAKRCPRKVGTICDTTPPPLVKPADGHGIYCHIPIEELNGSE